MSNSPTSKNTDEKFFGASELWKTLCTELYSDIDEKFLADFREPHNPANRFSTWQPKEPTFRYYLTLIFNYALGRDETFFSRYRKIGNTTVGQPLSVQVNGVDVNLDYMTSVEEFDFLDRNPAFKNVRTVAEIGAGFGRTAHTLLKLCPQIESYTIVDLEPMLKLSSGYLKKVLGDQFSKMRFVAAHDEKTWSNLGADLAINIDSFQEMPPKTIDGYRDGLLAKSPLVYVKNPVCKYSPSLLGIQNVRSHDVFALGYMTEVVNIFNEDDLKKMRELYETRFKPSAQHRAIDRRPSELFAYYQHVLYSTK